MLRHFKQGDNQAAETFFKYAKKSRNLVYTSKLPQFLPRGAGGGSVTIATVRDLSQSHLIQL